MAASRLGWAAVVAVFALMTLGNIVSATGSGLACPDWPLCHGRLIPPLAPDVLVEYSHRLAALLASVLIVATVILALRRSDGGAQRRVGVALLVLLGVQIALGGITVLFRLPHLISTAHLVNALLILAGLLILVAGSSAQAPGPSSLARLVRAGLGMLLIQLALGGYVRHSGAGLACPDFPLCSGELLPAHWLATAHWAHRWLGVALLGLFIHLGVAARGTAIAAPSRAAAGLALLQVGLGIAAVLWRLDPPVRAAHAAVGYVLWGTLVWISVGAGCWRSSAADAPGAGGRAQEMAHA